MESAMRARQLERVLVNHGAPRSFLDVVTRKLREEKRLAIGGRGPHAPEIGPAEATWIMVALAATDTAAHATLGLARQLALFLPTGVTPRHSTDFVDSVQIILGSPEWANDVAEIRVGRSHARSQIIYRDGVTENYVQRGSQPTVGSMAFRSEGVLGGGLVAQVALELTGANAHEPDYD